MVTPTTTTATIATTFVSCAAESDAAPPCDFAALYRAWRACRRGKRGTRKAQRYEIGLLDRLIDTAQALRQQTWRPSRAIRFAVRHPKPREILAAEFGDRVVHHLIVPWFERHFEPIFIHDSYANRKGKGSHAAVARLQDFCRRGGRREAVCAPAGADTGALHYLQLDVANFFNSIDRRRLFGLLRQRIERDARRPVADPRHAPRNEARPMLWLARTLLTGNPAHGALVRGKPADLARVPAHKQLINAPAETGLPIGNLTSQFFANVYLNELDQFVKHELKVRHYLRYVDDFVLLHPDPAYLETCRAAIADFLHTRLGLRLRDDGRLAPISNGIDFLGYIVRPHYRLVRRRVIGHMNERLAAHGRRLRRADGSLFLPAGSVDAVQATLASYLGHCRHARVGGLLDKLYRRHAWLGHLLITTGEPPRPQRVDRPRAVNGLADQWRYFQARYPGHVLMMQVGNRWECAFVGAAAAANDAIAPSGAPTTPPPPRPAAHRGLALRGAGPSQTPSHAPGPPLVRNRRSRPPARRPETSPTGRAVAGLAQPVSLRNFIMTRFSLVLASLLALLAPTAQAVTCASNIPASNPDSAYTVDSVNGTATDNRTGLMWKICAEGQTWSNGTCANSATGYPWAAALARAESATDANHNDWRLPNLKELRSLVEECRIIPSINDTVFPNAPSSYFWSGSPSAGSSYSAWSVYFGDGYAYGYDRGSSRHVRLVRGGQSSGANRPPVIGNATFGVTSKQLAGSFNVSDADNDTIKNIRLTMRGSGFYCRTGYLSKAFDQAINTGLINIVSTDCAAEATRFMNESGGAVTWELELYDSKGAKATSATGSLNQQGSITVPTGSKVIWTDSVTDFEIGTGYTLQFKMVDAQNNLLSQYSSVGSINVTGVDVEMDGKRLVWFDNGVANVTGFKAVSAGIGEIEVSAPVKYILPTQDIKQSGVELLTTGAVASVVLRASRAIKALSACPANPKLYVRLEQPDGSPVGTGQIQVGKVINQTVPAWTTYTKSGDVVELAGTIINPGEVVSIRYMPPNSVNWIDAGKIENLGKTCFSKSFTNKLAYKITSGKRPLILIPGIFGSTLDDKVNPYPIMPKSICKTKSDDCAKLEFYSALGDFLGWNELEEKLISMGYKVYRAPWDWRMGNLNDIAAQFLAPVIDQALKDSPGYTRVDVVAHSMGGLVTRAYIQNLGKGNAIDRFVMLGTPNGGSVNAYYLMSAVEMIKLDRAVQDIGAMLLKPDFYSNTANNVFRGMGMGALLSDGWFNADTNEGHGVSGYSYLYKYKKNRREAIKLAVPGGTNLLPLSTHDYLQALDFSDMTTSNRAATNNSDLSLLYNKGRENLLCNLSPKDRWGYDTDTNSAYTWLLLSANEKTITRAKVSLDSSKTEFANLVDDYSPSIDYLFSNGTLQFVATENSGDGTVPAAWATDGLDSLSGCIHQLNGGGHARMPGNSNIQTELFDILRLNRADISMAHSENKFSVTSDAPASFLNVQLAGPVVGLLSGSGGGVGVDGRSEFISTLPNATYQTLSDLSSYRVSPVEAGVYQLQLSAPVGFSGRLLPVDIHSNISGYNQLIRGYHIIGNTSVAIKFSLSTQGVLLLLDRPYRPRNLIINFSSDQQNTLISWDAPTDGTTTGYRIYSRLEGKQNFGLIASLSAGQLSYTYNGAAISSTSATPITEFVVVAVDAQGRESLASDIVSNVRQESVSDTAFAGQSTFESNAWVASSSIILSSINVPVAISINGGEYKLDNGAFTSAPGIVQPGQSVAVRVRSSATVGGTSMATLTVGESTMTFTVATLSKTHTLTVSKSGRGSGQVVSNPAGIDCGSACAAGFTTGAGVDLYATADEGSRFVGWSGACSGRATCSVTMADDKSVGATFTRKANSASTLAVIMAVMLDSQPAVSYAASPAVGVNADGSTIWLRLNSITGSKANFSIGKISGNFLSSGVFRILNNANYTGQEVNYTAGATTVSFAYELGTVPASHVIKAQRYDAANIAGGYDSNVVSGPVTVNVTLK